VGHDERGKRQVIVMTADDNISKMNRRIWIWLPLSGCILLLLSSLMQSKNNAALVSFEALNQSFANSVNLIHARWIQLNKPDTVQWQVEQKMINVMLNPKGWPIVDKNPASLQKNCQDIWLNILAAPLDIDGEKIFSSSLLINSRWQGCKYQFSELSFSYWFHNGRVEKNT